MHLNTCYLNAQKLARFWVSVKFKESNFLDKFVNHKKLFKRLLQTEKEKTKFLRVY
jgi:hypothetical protein